jgi:hypothetical protein
MSRVRKLNPDVGQAFQPDVRLESLTYHVGDKGVEYG